MKSTFWMTAQEAEDEIKRREARRLEIERICNPLEREKEQIEARLEELYREDAELWRKEQNEDQTEE